jgi:hypothetical protein
MINSILVIFALHALCAASVVSSDHHATLFKSQIRSTTITNWSTNTVYLMGSGSPLIDVLIPLDDPRKCFVSMLKADAPRGVVIVHTTFQDGLVALRSKNDHRPVDRFNWPGTTLPPKSRQLVYMYYDPVPRDPIPRRQFQMKMPVILFHRPRNQ